MDEHTSYELAFRNGYEKGYADALAFAQNELKPIAESVKECLQMCEVIANGVTLATDNNVGDKLSPAEPLTNCQQWIPVRKRLPDNDGRYLVRKETLHTPWYDVLYFAKDGRKIVEPKSRCHTGFSCKNGCGHNVNYAEYKCNVCGGGWYCQDCAYSSREGNKMYCNNPAMGK